MNTEPICCLISYGMDYESFGLMKIILFGYFIVFYNQFELLCL